MNLELIYNKIKENIDKVDFSKLWEGFYPLEFAVYNEKQCFFNGNYIEKTQYFLANTSIEYNGEYIAIWFIDDDTNIDYEALSASLIHEMFHGFQRINNESRFPNEMDALFNYEYNETALSIKIEEGKLMKSLMEGEEEKDRIFNKLMEYRKYRCEHFNEQYSYEAMVEQIEGTATYIEYKALEVISQEKYKKRIETVLNKITEMKNYIPIRIISYSVGALLFNILNENGINIFDFSDRPIMVSVLDNVQSVDFQLSNNEDVGNIVKGYYEKTDEIISNAIKSNNVVAEGNYQLLGLNIYDARYHNGFAVSMYFLMYSDGEKEVVLNGDFVIKFSQDKKIEKVYKIQ